VVLTRCNFIVVTRVRINYRANIKPIRCRRADQNYINRVSHMLGVPRYKSIDLSKGQYRWLYASNQIGENYGTN